MKKQDSGSSGSAEQDSVGDGEDGGYIPPDEPMGVQSFGTTVAEQRAGESFDQRSRHTTNEFDEADLAEPIEEVGQLVAPGDEDVDASDTEAAVIAWEQGAGDELSAEEAAMHTTESP